MATCSVQCGKPAVADFYSDAVIYDEIYLLGPYPICREHIDILSRGRYPPSSPITMAAWSRSESLASPPRIGVRGSAVTTARNDPQETLESIRAGCDEMLRYHCWMLMNFYPKAPSRSPKAKLQSRSPRPSSE